MPHKVIFTPSGIRATAEEGQSVYDVALASGVDILSICGGKGLCRRCQIEFEPGDYPKFGVWRAKELYALYMQCDELFWQRARQPQSALTLEEYQNHLKGERQSLLVRALLFWLAGVAVLFLASFLIIRASAWLKPGSDTHTDTG